MILSFQKIGTSTLQSRAVAGVAGGTYLFALPGSPSACRDAWMICWRINSITGIAHVILSRLCRVCAKPGWWAVGQGNRLVTMFIAR